MELYTRIKTTSEDFFGTVDLKTDKQTFEKEIYAKLDPSIRVKLRNTGVTIQQNIYTGYDTEYKAISVKDNQLLSVQMCVNARIIIKFPNNKDFKISRVGSLTSDVYELKGCKIMDQAILENRINRCIQQVRKMLNYTVIDESMKNIVKKLKDLGYPYIEDNKQFTFAFDRTPINQ
jgi:hypothetical protein